MTEQVLLKTDDARVRIITLAAGEGGQWHRHSAVADQIIGLSGRLHIQLLEPTETLTLDPTGQAQIEIGRQHRVSNASRETASYVLVQGPGKYDFLVD